MELRTQNYQLSDDLRKNSAGNRCFSKHTTDGGGGDGNNDDVECFPELNTVRQKNVVLERDFIKAQKVSDNFMD